jgi:hypothetical protein
LVTTSVYGVVVLGGGVMISEPDDPSIALPGLRVPVRLFSIDHERRAPLPLTILFGLIEILQLGGVTGGTTTTALVVTEAVQELVPAELVTTSTYGVIALDGGVTRRDPDAPRIALLGLSVPVRLFVIVHERSEVPPLRILVGFAVIVQVGGDTTTFVDASAKNEK